MNTSYDRIAGQSVERLAALSDGIFGVGMTLLLLDLHIPEEAQVLNAADLAGELEKMVPQLFVYLMSFVTLGLFWVGQQTQLNHLKRSDRHLTWINLAFLFGVTLLPCTTRLLANFTEYRLALIVYWANIFLLGATLYACWGRATRAKLIDDELSITVQAAICKRIVIAQALYAFGAALCFFSTYLSIGFIVLVQLNYAIAPSEWEWRKKSAKKID